MARLKLVDFVLYRGSDDPVSGVALSEAMSGEPGERESVAVSRGTHWIVVYAVAGLGQPAQFLERTGRLGFTLESTDFADHYMYSAADFSGLQRKADYHDREGRGKMSRACG